MAKLDRLLNLLAALLDTTVPLTAEELRARVPGYPDAGDSFHRAFERDKDDLRELGIPVETVQSEHHEQPRSAYIIHRSRYELRDPGFELDELTAIHLAATTIQLEGLDPDDVEEGLRKLGGLGAVAGAPGMSASGSPPVGALPVPDSLLEIFVAVLERRPVHFEYSGLAREVDPYRLQFERGRWYLTGHDTTRDDRRSFRLDRISGPVTSGAPDGFVRPAEVGGVLLRPWEIGDGEPVPTTVLLDAEPARSVLVEHPDVEVVERREDGSVVVRLQVRSVEALRNFCMTMLDHAEVLDPPEIRAGIVAWLERFEEAGR